MKYFGTSYQDDLGSACWEQERREAPNPADKSSKTPEEKKKKKKEPDGVTGQRKSASSCCHGDRRPEGRGLMGASHVSPDDPSAFVGSVYLINISKDVTHLFLSAPDRNTHEFSSNTLLISVKL